MSVLITNTKSYMSFRLVPKSVTLSDFERPSDPYLCVISSICVRSRRRTSTSVSKSTFDSLWPY